MIRIRVKERVFGKEQALVRIRGPGAGLGQNAAVDLAREHGLVLAGMVRGGGLNIYAGTDHVS